MSNAKAIAATTATLLHLLSSRIPSLIDGASVDVTTLPPDRARKGHTGAQLNIFLYQTQVNAAWRNLDVPRQVRPGESAIPPLALNLHYMLTAYGDDNQNDDEMVSHRVLGAAMSVLHDHPLLGRAEIAAALADSGLDAQFERLRVTPIALSMDEMSKLWTAMQSNYRLSAGYEVTVVLIDSNVPVKAALPVLKRGADDRGPVATAARAPALDAIRYPRGQQAARLGDDVVISGSGLGAANALVRFNNSRLAEPITLPPAAGGRSGEITLHLPSPAEDPGVMTQWAPGLYSVVVVVQTPDGHALDSNELAFALAPTIVPSPGTHAAGSFDLDVRCTPRIAAGQRVLLLFDADQYAPASVDQPAPAGNDPSLATFAQVQGTKNPDGTPAQRTVRLRVDGVDSIPVVVDGSPPRPRFDPDQQVAIT
ncbi:MAG: DUF4255 domain-containing protein [Burkholderiaceae bacterium]